ncbi:hypothetical protein PV10_05589 [Exophiala mesophila]|uniref:Uncharacterized protein n=1 Tax=Exophiala mesophila TaxID=212818 RepID=A0A0D1WPM0_EXOME|nr:uncharacterized protein PV10_05589 [Exophiala mesophila]KIV90995.1 hypothetical protein PV10_05589 [Exophiala mesophila]
MSTNMSPSTTSLKSKGILNGGILKPMKRCQTHSVSHNGRVQKNPRPSSASRQSLTSIMPTRRVSQGAHLRKRSERLALCLAKADNQILNISAPVGGQSVPPQAKPSAPLVVPGPEPTSSAGHPLEFMGRPKIYRSPDLFGGDSKYADPDFKPSLDSLRDPHQQHLTWPQYAASPQSAQVRRQLPTESLGGQMEVSTVDKMELESQQLSIPLEQIPRHQYKDVVMTDPSGYDNKQTSTDTSCVVLAMQDVCVDSSTPPETQGPCPPSSTGFVRDGWLAKRHDQKRLTSRLQRWHPHRRQSTPKKTESELLSPKVLEEIFKLDQEPEPEYAVDSQQATVVQHVKASGEALRQNRPRKNVRFNLIPEILGPRHVSSDDEDSEVGPLVGVEQEDVPENLDDLYTSPIVRTSGEDTTSKKNGVTQQRQRDSSEPRQQNRQSQRIEAAQKETRLDDGTMPNKEGVNEPRSRLVTRVGAVISRYMPASLGRLWV